MKEETAWVLVLVVVALTISWLAFNAKGCMGDKNLKLQEEVVACTQQLIGCQGVQ